MKSKIHLFLVVLVILPLSVFSQARLVINNNPFIVLNGGTSSAAGAYLVIGNSAANAITWTGTAQADGGIISEGQFNILKWNIGNTFATYTIPFTQTYGTVGIKAIPVVITTSSASAGGGTIQVSTYGRGSTDATNSGYLPSGFTGLSMATATGGEPSNANNSYNVVDRFWIVEASGYTTKPTGTMTFNYVDLEHSTAPNTIGESFLQAQRWDDASDDWNTYGLSGTQGAGSYQGQVSGISFSNANFEKAWTLVDNRAPLPIELIEFKADCENGEPNIYWTTATETNNKFFTIEKSADGKEFIEIATVASLAVGGYSTGKLNYHYVDKNTVTGNYYRLKQTDNDGKFEYSKIIFNECGADNTKPNSVDVYPNPTNGVVNVLLTGYENQNIQITIMNSIGQIVADKKIQANGSATTQKESFSLMEQAKGIYYVSVISDKEKTTHKIINQY